MLRKLIIRTPIERFKVYHQIVSRKVCKYIRNGLRVNQVFKPEHQQPLIDFCMIIVGVVVVIIVFMIDANFLTGVRRITFGPCSSTLSYPFTARCHSESPSAGTIPTFFSLIGEMAVMAQHVDLLHPTSTSHNKHS